MHQKLPINSEFTTQLLLIFAITIISNLTKITIPFSIQPGSTAGNSPALPALSAQPLR